MSKQAIAAELRELGLKRVLIDEPMARYTSWRIGGPADCLCQVETEEELLAAIAVALAHAVPWLVLGGGNNILVADAGIEGLVILNRLKEIAIEADEEPRVRCGAGVFFAKAAQYTARNGYSGLEWGVAIPGTVGGGVVNNAGAHATEVSEALIDVTIVDAVGHREELSLPDLSYRYRQSALKSPHTAQTQLVVVSCRFRLEHADATEAVRRVEEYRQHRLRTQPVKEPSAGSTFKNPPGDHAGALIDRAGLKGKRIGGAEFAPLHANFILNRGGATAADVVSLVELAEREVKERFGVQLEPEIQFVGRWNQEWLRRVVPQAA